MQRLVLISHFIILLLNIKLIFTAELVQGNNIPRENIPSKAPAVIPDKLFPA